MVQKSEYPTHVLDHMATTVLLLDQNLHLLYTNPAGEFLLSSSVKKCIGLHLKEIIAGPDEFYEVLERALHTGRPFMEQAIKLELYGPNKIAVDCSVTAIEEPNRESQIVVELVNRSQTSENHAR